MINRRKFLQYSAAGLAGSMVPLVSGAAHADTLRPENRKRDIIYRTLGKTGIKLPVVSLGELFILIQRTFISRAETKRCWVKS